MKQLLALTDGPDFACYRYRIDAFRDALAERGWQLSVLSKPRAAASFLWQLRSIAAADAVILQRRLLCWWKRRLLRQAAKVLLYDFDDAVFVRDSSNRNLPDETIRWHRFRQTVRMADACFAGNGHLRQQATLCGKMRDVHFMPTCVDLRRHPIAAHQRLGSNVQLVWVGSRGGRDSLVHAEAGIRNAVGQLPGLTLKVIGDAFPDLPGVRILPIAWSSGTESAEIAAADIGIAWLSDDRRSLGNCGLTVLQYMAAGLPVIANPVGIHHDLVVHGETGFLASTPQELGHAVTRLAHSPALRRQMGCAGRDRLAQRYSVQHWGPSFAALIDEACLAADQRSSPRGADPQIC